ncbi:MAG: MarR family winged helix-turn-helix transcriptional regulator [Casimicrobiaceae bacterium]
MTLSTEIDGSLLREVTRLYARAQRMAADCCGTTPTQCQVITELARTGPIPVGEVGKRLCLEKSWTGRAIDGLVTEGLVVRAPNPADSRSWLVSLTAAGKRRYRALNDQLEAHAERVISGLSAAERAAVNQSLGLLLRALRKDAGVTTPSCCAVLPDSADVAD